MKFCLAFLASLLAGTVALGASEARDCRVPYQTGRTAPKPPPGCDLPAKAGEAGRLKQQSGFVDLGNGTQVRISGRVRVDAGVRR
jgi:hypothetical protein